MSCVNPSSVRNSHHNSWIDHVKRESARLGICFGAGIRDARVKASYTRQTKGKKTDLEKAISATAPQNYARKNKKIIKTSPIKVPKADVQRSLDELQRKRRPARDISKAVDEALEEDEKKQRGIVNPTLESLPREIIGEIGKFLPAKKMMEMRTMSKKISEGIKREEVEKKVAKEFEAKLRYWKTNPYDITPLEEYKSNPREYKQKQRLKQIDNEILLDAVVRSGIYPNKTYGSKEQYSTSEWKNLPSFESRIIRESLSKLPKEKFERLLGKIKGKIPMKTLTKEEYLAEKKILGL